MHDPIKSPRHYDFRRMEAREIIELAIADFRDPATVYHVASALKYLLRASRKDGADDIAKARKHVGWALGAARTYDARKPSSPDYDHDSVAFRHGDLAKVCGIGDVPHMTAQVLAPRDGAGDYGNPVTPGCATPWRLP